MVVVVVAVAAVVIMVVVEVVVVMEVVTEMVGILPVFHLGVSFCNNSLLEILSCHHVKIPHYFICVVCRLLTS